MTDYRFYIIDADRVVTYKGKNIKLNDAINKIQMESKLFTFTDVIHSLIVLYDLLNKELEIKPTVKPKNQTTENNLNYDIHT